MPALRFVAEVAASLRVYVEVFPTALSALAIPDLYRADPGAEVGSHNESSGSIICWSQDSEATSIISNVNLRAPPTWPNKLIHALSACSWAWLKAELAAPMSPPNRKARSSLIAG